MTEEIYTEDELDILHEVHASAKMRGPESNVYEQIRQRIPRIIGCAHDANQEQKSREFYE